MNCFFNHINDVKLPSGMEEDRLLEEQFLKEVTYQGRTYSLYHVYVRKLGHKEKWVTFFKCLVEYLFSVATSLIFFRDFMSYGDLRDKWHSVFADKEIRAVYLSFDENIQKSDPDLNAENGILTIYFPWKTKYKKLIICI